MFIEHTETGLRIGYSFEMRNKAREYRNIQFSDDSVKLLDIADTVGEAIDYKAQIDEEFGNIAPESIEQELGKVEFLLYEAKKKYREVVGRPWKKHLTMEDMFWDIIEMAFRSARRDDLQWTVGKFKS